MACPHDHGDRPVESGAAARGNTHNPAAHLSPMAVISRALDKLPQTRLMKASGDSCILRRAAGSMQVMMLGIALLMGYPW